MPSELNRSLIKAVACDLGLVGVVLAANAYGTGLSQTRLVLLAVLFVFLGTIAFTNHAELARSTAAYKRSRELVTRYGTADAVPYHAWWMLGILESEAGNVEHAWRAFEHLAASDDPNASAWGWLRLGLMAQAVGNDDEARSAFVHTSNSNDATLAAHGWLGQAQLALADGDLHGARALAELAEDTGDAEVSVRALALLSDVELRMRERAERAPIRTGSLSLAH